MKVLVTGAGGQLGYDIAKKLESKKICCKGTTRDDFDITNERATKEYIRSYSPDTIIHCAAYTSVDKAEEERDICYKTNVLGTGYIAEACAGIGAKLVYISTDYIFGGTGTKPFDVSDNPDPVNYYGLTKYEGELKVQEKLERYFIIRISWVFGSNGNNFVKTMLKLAEKNDEIKVVSDQIGSPTYTVDAAGLISDMIMTEKYGVYHITNEGFCSWYEFANNIFENAGLKVKLIPITSHEYPAKANRPGNSRLSKDKLTDAGFVRLPHYKDALYRFINHSLHTDH